MTHRHANRFKVPSLFRPFGELNPFFEEFTIDEEREGTGLSVYEDKDKIFVEADLPGLKKEDITVSFEKGILWVKGECREEKKDVKHHIKSSRSFSYRVPIPVQIDEHASPEAIFKDGVLKVSFEKTRASKPQQINVKLG